MEEAKFHETMAEAKAGSTAAVSSLLVAGFTPLRAAIVSLMSDLPSEAQIEPEDIIQEVYAAASTNLPSAEFENFGAFLAWLRQIAENRLIDIRRALLAEKRDVRRQTSAWVSQQGTNVDVLDR